MADHEMNTDLPSTETKAKASNQVPQSHTDASLVRRFRRGEDDAATALYLRYANRLGALASAKTGDDLRTRFDPEDIVQSVFRTLFRRVSLGSYDVPDGDELWGLLLVVTLNKTRKAAARHRAGKRDVRATAADGEMAISMHADHDRQSMAELKAVIEEFTESLDPLHRDVIDMRVAGYEVAEIAERLGRSKRTVERVLQRTRSTLRKQIDD